MLGAHMPWQLALTSPVLDCVASIAPFAPRLVVKSLGAKGQSCAIDCKLTFWAEQVDALWWGRCPLSRLLWGILCSAAAAASHLHLSSLPRCIHSAFWFSQGPCFTACAALAVDPLYHPLNRAGPVGFAFRPKGLQFDKQHCCLPAWLLHVGLTCCHVL